MIDTDPRVAANGGAYAPPTLSELIDSAAHLQLIDGVEETLRGIRIRLVGQVYDLKTREAELMLTGLLLGYFAAAEPTPSTFQPWLP